MYGESRYARRLGKRLSFDDSVRCTRAVGGLLELVTGRQGASLSRACGIGSRHAALTPVSRVWGRWDVWGESLCQEAG